MKATFKKSKKSICMCVSGLALLVLAGFVVFGCGGGGSDDNSAPIDSSSVPSDAFPRGLMVFSPFDLSSSSSSPSSFDDTYADSRTISSLSSSGYDDTLSEINNLLDAESAGSCTFDPVLFYERTVNADCYGPTVTYENHPDGTPSDGELPVGDVGIWMETTTSGEPCATAQLNARMLGFKYRSKASLMGLASIVCAINNDTTGSYAIPDNSTTDATAIMPTPSGVTWNLATLTHATVDSEEKYSYILDFDYNGKRVYVNMAHIPGTSSADVYRGRFSYQIDYQDPVSGGNCPSSSLTWNGSLVYNKTSATALTMEMKEGQFCGFESNGWTSEGIVDVTKTYDASTEPDGWGNDFNILRGSFNPLTRIGSFAYAWQAGCGDANIRAFNIVTSDDGIDGTEDMTATAFFGYGMDISNDDPSITGFICNWAGPGSTRAMTGVAQKQVVSYNNSTGKFETISSNILYAPTNSCDHPGGGFSFDSDADGVTDSTTSFFNELVVGSDTDGDSTDTIEETISAAGVTVPASPSCSSCNP